MIETGLNGWLMLGFAGSNNGDVSGNHGVEDYWIVKLTDNPLFVIDNISDRDIEIYPNPFRNLIAIHSSSELNGEIKVMNAFGATVYESKINENLFIDLSFLSDGIYFLEYRDEHRSLIKKIIKMN